MSALAFDTHRAVQALCEAGAAEPLAEAFVETSGDAVSGNVATKADIAESEARVQVKIAEVQAETKADIAGVRAEVAEVRTEVANVRAELKADLGGLEGRLYRQLWLMAVGTVGLVKLLG